jgi:hypothetical protein
VTTALADVQQRLRATGQAERAKAAVRADHVAAARPPESIPLLPTPCNVAKVREWWQLTSPTHVWHVMFPGGVTMDDVRAWAYRAGYDVTITAVDGRP